MLQSTDPEKLNNKDGSRGHLWLSLGRGNRTEFMGGLGMGRGGYEMDQVRVGWRKSTRRTDWS